MANEFMGWQRYLTIAAESTWGTTPGSPTYTYTPVGSCGIKVTPRSKVATPLLGIRQRKHQRKHGYSVGGNISLPFFGLKQNSKAIAEWFIEAALSAPAGNALDSLVVEYGEAGTDNKRWNGMRINSLTLSGDADSGAVNLSVDFRGKSETGGITLQSIPADMNFLEDADFADVSFKIAAYAGTPAAIDIKSFQLTINNNLQEKFINSTTPGLLLAGERECSLQVTIYKNANTYDALRRTAGSSSRCAQLIIKALHGEGGGSPYRQVTFDFDRINFQDAAEGGSGLNDVAEQSPDFIVLKDDTSSNDVDTTWADAA